VSDCTVPTCEADCTTALWCATVDNGPSSIGGCYWEEGVPIPPGGQTGVCCPDLFVWSPGEQRCKDFEPCFDAIAPSPCPYDPGNPFNPIDSAWWTFTPSCIDDNAGNDNACCFVEDFGGPTYDYVFHSSY